jgi:hypothetical protein
MHAASGQKRFANGIDPRRMVSGIADGHAEFCKHLSADGHLPG